MASTEIEDHLVQREMMEKLVTKEGQDLEDHPGWKDLKVIQGLLASLVHQESRVHLGSKVSLEVLGTMVRKETVACRVTLDLLVRWVYRAHLENQAMLDHQVNRATLDHQVLKEMLVLRDLLVYKELLEIKDHQDLKDLQVWLVTLVLLEMLEHQVHQENLDHQAKMEMLDQED